MPNPSVQSEKLENNRLPVEVLQRLAEIEAALAELEGHPAVLTEQLETSHPQPAAVAPANLLNNANQSEYLKTARDSVDEAYDSTSEPDFESWEAA